MCSNFEQRMENYQAGDLTDIVRASGGGGGGFSGEVVADWQFPADPMNYPSGIEEPVEDFGDPFSNMRDPLLNELDIPSSSFFNNSSANMMKTTTTTVEDTTTTTATGFCCGDVFSQKIVGVDEEEMMMIKKRPCNNNNIFSRMLQISPNATKLMPISSGDSPVVASPRGIKVSPLVANDLISTNASAKSCLVENSGTGGGGGGVQISSPRNTGIKRRKSQAKKVVCIPAPAPANSRPSGEVVPSDLWAWRKYGQKPIKGSPYPRGYYRCSSSKGCSARKQVERSRTDPNMLVITYTSEHNHPWPTQRNALAGSTRTQPTTKNNNNSKNSPSVSSQSHQTQTHKPTPGGGLNNKEEQHKEKEMSTNTTGTSTAIKEEILEDVDHQSQSQAHNDDHDHDDDHEDDEFLSSEGGGFPFPTQSYRPALPDHSSNFNNLLQSHHNEDFFADLGEIEADLLFTQGFSEDMMMIRSTGNNNNKALDPFTSLFDWNGNSNHHTSFGEAKRGL